MGLWVEFLSFFSFHDSLFPPNWKPNTLLVYSYGSSLNLVTFDSAGTLILCSWLIPGGTGVSKSFKRCAACLFYCVVCLVLFAAVLDCLSLWQEPLCNSTQMKSCQIVNNSITNGSIRLNKFCISFTRCFFTKNSSSFKALVIR